MSCEPFHPFGVELFDLNRVAKVDELLKEHYEFNSDRTIISNRAKEQWPANAAEAATDRMPKRLERVRTGWVVLFRQFRELSLFRIPVKITTPSLLSNRQPCASEGGALIIGDPKANGEYRRVSLTAHVAS